MNIPIQHPKIPIINRFRKNGKKRFMLKQAREQIMIVLNEHKSKSPRRPIWSVLFI